MPALNFQKRFADAVESGAKRQTIRAPRRDGRPSATVGARLYLYTGMRTKGCRKLGEATCRAVRAIEIDTCGRVKLDGQALCEPEVNRLAQKDGFDSGVELRHFFQDTYGLPFEGSLIEWQPV